MRYRPFGGSGVAVSSVSIRLVDTPEHPRDAKTWSGLIHRALECGVNCFEVAGPSPALIQGLALGFGDLERRLFFVSWCAGAVLSSQFQAVQLSQDLQAAASESGLGSFDLLMVDEPPGSPTVGDVAAAAAALQSLTESGLVRFLGVRGGGDGADAAVQTGAFDAIATPYSLAAEWRDRNRLKEASRRDMAVIGLHPYPQAMREAAKGAKPKRSGIWRRVSDPLSGAGTYQFLNNTLGWTAEEICLSFALTEPALATVQMEVRDEAHLDALAEIPERDLPAGVSAQIEMARFSPAPASGERRRTA
jgi:aryl-alcohol dehydrogenase-like predicted oxidoreductase